MERRLRELVDKVHEGVEKLVDFLEGLEGWEEEERSVLLMAVFEEYLCTASVTRALLENPALGEYVRKHVEKMLRQVTPVLPAVPNN